MMMIMIAGFVDSITAPIKCWLDKEKQEEEKKKKMMMRIKEVEDKCEVVECIVCLSDVGLGERFATLERCGHRFHVECVEAWLKDHPNCPLCRTPTTTITHKCYCINYFYLYETMTRYGFHVLDTMATWLTAPFTKGLDSALSESCTYL
ncbi:hypothetical protein QVD17_07283 [Tagetes erecta]|uniref:RING-type domain-containing protein n=1 Tax=Tagetes erecta TaxID=13708 RepID=A0AAD8LLT9_TARER|nr:hypothetical protein QVD17_07283 [Tagetes erecta]